MITTCIIAAALVLGQASDFHGRIPEGTQIFDMQGEYVALRTRAGEWITDISELQGHTQVEIYHDRPWDDPSPEMVRIGRVGEPRRAFNRTERLERGWEEAGYVFVPTVNGERPVQRKEVELAQRAQEMAQALDAQHAAAPAAAAAAPPGFAAQWGPHLLLGLGGLVLIVIVARTMLMED